MKFLLIATVLFAAVAADPASERALLTQRRELGFVGDMVKDATKTITKTVNDVTGSIDTEDWKKALGSMGDLIKGLKDDATKAFNDCEECKKLGASADAVGKKVRIRFEMRTPLKLSPPLHTETSTPSHPTPS